MAKDKLKPFLCVQKRGQTKPVIVRRSRPALEGTFVTLPHPTIPGKFVMVSWPKNAVCPKCCSRGQCSKTAAGPAAS